MEVKSHPQNQDGQINTTIQEPKNIVEKKRNDRFKWWQSLLILTLTLVITVGACYFVSKKYIWPKYDTNHFAQQLETAKAAADAKPNEPKSHVDLGYAYFLNKKNDEAIKQYQMAIDLDKNYFDAYFNLGLIYNEENRLNDAVKMAQKATEISPKDYKGYLLKGMALRKLKMYPNAIDALNKAKNLMQGNTDIINEIARVLEDKGDKAQAEEIYKDALSYDPLYKPALEGLKRVAKK